jgi:hypothetical protein
LTDDHVASRPNERSLRIATWNLERPSLRSWKRLPRQLARLREVNADLWVLTETRLGVCPGDGFEGLHTPPHPQRRPDADERWVGIWSRWPLIPTGIPPEPSGSVSAVVDRPEGPFVVYGTVLPWANEPGEDGTAGMWEIHHREIVRQGEDWRRIRLRFPDLPIVVAGDFNQDRDGSGWYGSRRGRALLTEALEGADLRVLTGDDMVASGRLARNHLVDHIAVSSTWSLGSDVEVSCWEPRDSDGTHLSDHPTVAVALRERAPSD